MSHSLAGRQVLVTGGGGDGIAAGICAVLARQGARIFINDVQAAKAEAAAARHPGAVALPGDISSSADVERMFAAIAAQGVVLDGLVNNAGVGLSKKTPQVSDEEFDRLYGVDVRGMFLVTRAFLRQLQPTRRPGSIVNISSIHARTSMPQYALYAGAKAAVEGLTRGWATELGPHLIRCNAVAPGYVHAEQNEKLIKTWAADPRAWVREHTRDQQPLPVEVTGPDCGEAVAFFLSEASRCITGQTVCVDCGLTINMYPRSFVPLKE